MNTPDNKAVFFKREALKRVVQAFDQGILETNAYRIPYEVIPQDSKSAVRCCIYKERAVFRARVLAALGGSIEQDDEATSLNDYAKKALLRKQVPATPLTVLTIACKGCIKARHLVTEACQGCLARPCQQACKFGAISFENGRSKIDPDKCKNCGQCKNSCPYNAITYVPVPCEQICPVEAIHKTEDGFAQINTEKCISCGQCLEACPFGAIMERSQLIDVLCAMKKHKTCAMIAPSIVGQLDCTMPQLVTALQKAGFDKVTEVALGADITTANEARELVERLEKGARFMTTSCCAAWMQAVKKHLPALKDFVSHTKTPAGYCAEIEKANGFTTVFIGPCVSKRAEGSEDPNIDYVLTYEELDALLQARRINPADCQEAALDTSISAEARYYGVTGGVAQAVENAIAGKYPFTKMAINGLDRKAMLLLNAFAKGTGDFQLLEVMSCKGGCIGGPCTVKKQAQTIGEIKKFVAQSPQLKDLLHKKK